MNLHSSVHTDPVNFIDPTGLCDIGCKVRDRSPLWTEPTGGSGHRVSLTRGNGAVTSYSYDNVSRLSQLVHNPAGTSYDLTIDLSYNPASQITDKWLVKNTMCSNPLGDPNGGGGGDGQLILVTAQRGLQVDRCAARATGPLSGLPSFYVDAGRLQAVAQAKFLQHSWPLNPRTLEPQSSFGGWITSGETLAEAVIQLVLTHGYTPTGGVNVRITGDMGHRVGTDAYGNLPTTTYLTAIFGPPIFRPGRLPERLLISAFPGC